MDCLYWSPPTAAELEATPWYRAEDYPEPEVGVWDENWDVLIMFAENITQWRTTGHGVIGLDYNVFHSLLKWNGASLEVFKKTMSDLAIIEQQALKNIHK